MPEAHPPLFRQKCILALKWSFAAKKSELRPSCFHAKNLLYAITSYMIRSKKIIKNKRISTNKSLQVRRKRFMKNVCP